MLSRISLKIAIIFVLLQLTGCVAMSTVDQSKLAGVRNIVIATPNAPMYPAGLGSSPKAVNPAGLGIVSAIIVSANQDKPAIFDEQVKNKMNNPNLNKEFIDLVKEDLSKSGYQVTEQNFYPETSNPRVAVKNKEPALVGDPIKGADIIIIPWIFTAYQAPGVTWDYRRSVLVELYFFDGKNNENFGRRSFVFDPSKKLDGEKEAYKYSSFETLKENTPQAFEGLRNALFSLRSQVVETLKKDNQTIEAKAASVQ